MGCRWLDKGQGFGSCGTEAQGIRAGYDVALDVIEYGTGMVDVVHKVCTVYALNLARNDLILLGCNEPRNLKHPGTSWNKNKNKNKRAGTRWRYTWLQERAYLG
jgi:hypothetical protein